MLRVISLYSAVGFHLHVYITVGLVSSSPRAELLRKQWVREENECYLYLSNFKAN